MGREAEAECLGDDDGAEVGPDFLDGEETEAAVLESSLP